MIQSLDHVIFAVADLDAAAAAYATLLGRDPSWRGAHPGLGTRNVLFRLGDIYLELLAAGSEAAPLAEMVRDALGDRDERPFGLALRVQDIDAAVAAASAQSLQVTSPQAQSGVDAHSGRQRTWRSAFIAPESVRGMRLLLIQHTSPADALPLTPAEAASCYAIDHVVVATSDPDAASALWTRGFGLTEGWRREFPERGTRNFGLNIGGLSFMELIARTDRPGKPVRPDTLWGIAYRVTDCDAAVRRLRAAGVTLDDGRPGLAAGTRVTTVRWPRTPTLLIQPA